MSSPIDRRTFLKQAAAASLILGFPFLARAKEPAEPNRLPPGANPQCEAGIVLQANAAATAATADDVMRQAVERMTKQHKPGVVLFAPADPAAATALAKRLEQVLDGGSSAVHQAFCEAVFVCLPAAEAKRFAGRKAEWGAVLIDAGGKAIDGMALDPQGNVKDDFGAKALDLIHGPERARVRATAAAQREAMDAGARDRFDAAVADLSHRDFRKREAAADRLAEFAPAAASVLAETVARTDDPEARRGLQATFTRVFQSAAPQDRAPFGTAWVQEAVDPCRGCGMSRLPLQSRTFLRLTCGAAATGAAVQSGAGQIQAGSVISETPR